MERPSKQRSKEYLLSFTTVPMCTPRTGFYRPRSSTWPKKPELSISFYAASFTPYAARSTCIKLNSRVLTSIYSFLNRSLSSSIEEFLVESRLDYTILQVCDCCILDFVDVCIAAYSFHAKRVGFSSSANRCHLSWIFFIHCHRIHRSRRPCRCRSHYNTIPGSTSSSSIWTGGPKCILRRYLENNRSRVPQGRSM